VDIILTYFIGDDKDLNLSKKLGQYLHAVENHLYPMTTSLESITEHLLNIGSETIDELLHFSRTVIADIKRGRISMVTGISTAGLIIVSSMATRTLIHAATNINRLFFEIDDGNLCIRKYIFNVHFA
jgi:hypothetical protein